MPATFAHDVYPAADPAGKISGTGVAARLVRLTVGNQLSDGYYRHVLHGMGSGWLDIHTDHADATPTNIAKRNYVQYIRTDTIPEQKIGGYWLENGEFDALSRKERGGRILRYGGPGAAFILDRMNLGHAVYAPGQPNRGDFNVPGQWTWSQEPYGAMLVRVVEEGQNMPGAPLGALTLSPNLTRTRDSSNLIWPTLSDWHTPIGTSGLEVYEAFLRLGVVIQVDADLVLWAYRNLDGFSSDRTSGVFAADKVRFEGGKNIAADLSKKVEPALERSHVRVINAEGDVLTVSTGGIGVPYYDILHLEETADADAMQVAGERFLAQRDKMSDQAKFPHLIGPGGVSGADGYSPGPGADYWVGTLATLHTGTGQHDFNEQPIEVAAVGFELDPAGNTLAVPELGAQYLSASQRAVEEKVSSVIRRAGSHRHPPNPRLCEHEIGPNLLLGLATGSIKVSSEDAANPREEACDGDVGTVWDGVDGVGVPDEYWAADLGSSKAASVFRLITDTPAHSTNFAPSLALYGSNDPAAWTWLPAGKIAADPTANGWTLVSGYSGQTFPVDTGNVPFATQTFRHWMFRATSGATGGTTDWDINEVTLADIDPTTGESPRASRCDHNHYAENLLTTETSTDQRLAPDGSGGVQWVAMAEGMVGWFIRSNYATANDMIAAYNANGGGVLYWPAGEYSESVGLDPITAGGLILGDGHAHRDGTTQAVSRINLSSTTDSLFTIAAHAVTLRGLALVQNGSTPSAGAGITVTSGGHARYENLSVSGFFHGINIQDGEHWEARGCYIYNTVSHGWQIAHTDLPDGGDWSILGGWVTAAARTAAGANAINYISGGGGKIMGVKINADSTTRYTDGIALNIPSSVTTVDLQIVANNIENVSRHAISLTTTGSGTFRHVDIAANHTGFWAGTNNAGKAVNIVAASAGSIKDITIGPNTFYGGSGTNRSAMQLTNVDNVTLIPGNLSGAFTSLYTESGSTNIEVVGAGATDLDGLTDVTISGPVVGQVLRHNGSSWVNAGLSAADYPFHDEPLTDGASNFIFADGDVVVVTGVPN